MQEKFALGQNTGKDISKLSTEKASAIAAELTKSIDVAFHAEKLDTASEAGFEKSKEAELK